MSRYGWPYSPSNGVAPALLDGDVRVPDRAAELVELPLRDVGSDHMLRVRPEVGHPWDDVAHQGLVEVLVAGETRLAEQRRALVDLRVDARDVPAVPLDMKLDALRGSDPDEGVVCVAGGDDRAAVEERREERQWVGDILPPAGPLTGRDVPGRGLQRRVCALDRVYDERDPD